MTIGGFYKHTELSRSTSLGEYRVSNLYFPKGRREASLYMIVRIAKEKLGLMLSGSTIMVVVSELLGKLTNKLN